MKFTEFQKLSVKDGDKSEPFSLKEGIIFQMGGTRMKGTIYNRSNKMNNNANSNKNRIGGNR